MGRPLEARVTEGGRETRRRRPGRRCTSEQGKRARRAIAKYIGRDRCTSDGRRRPKRTSTREAGRQAPLVRTVTPGRSKSQSTILLDFLHILFSIASTNLNYLLCLHSVMDLRDYAPPLLYILNHLSQRIPLDDIPRHVPSPQHDVGYPSRRLSILFCPAFSIALAFSSSTLVAKESWTG
jgi:hypothetical protein